MDYGPYRYDRVLRVYAPEDVLPHVILDQPKIHGKRALAEGFKRNFDGDWINMTSDRLKVFARSRVCAGCGVEGTRFYKERNFQGNDRKYHFNLYAVLQDGSEVLMTKDHIIPRSRGGANCLENYQTMCLLCNEKKGSKL